MPWTRFLALLPIPLRTRPVPPKIARAGRIIILRPRLLTARRSPQIMKMIRERIKYVVRRLDPLWAGSTFPGGALAIAQGHRTAAKHHPRRIAIFGGSFDPRSEEHTSELQSHLNLVCRLLLEKKKKKIKSEYTSKKKKKI